MSDQDSEPDPTASMAAAMGFSGFGAQRPSKKRRYNSKTDSFVASASSSEFMPSFTGGNLEPLGERGTTSKSDRVARKGLPVHSKTAGERRGIAQATGGNEDEIVLDDDENDEAPVAHGSANAARQQAATVAEDSAATATQDSHPPHPPPKLLFNTAHDPQTHRQQGRANHRGPRTDEPGQEWWQNYTDVSFIQNPWVKLEKQLGIEARGSWPEDAR